MFTNAIRFGLTGYGLLMTHDIPGQLPKAQLTRWDVSDLHKPSETLYLGADLAFPIEVKPGLVLVRSCKPYDFKPESCKGGGGTYWLLVNPDGTAKRVSPEHKSLTYSQPNITSEGFFWLDQYKNREQPDRRAVLAYPLPGGHQPEVDVSMLDMSTADLDCDYQTQRCLHSFNAGKNPINGHYIYDVEIFEGTKRCRPQGLRGWTDGHWVSPDGRAAVMSLAEEYDSPRHVVVMRFKPGQCEPTLISHLNF